MLERDRFLEIKELAQKVREENENLFEAFKMEAPDDAIREKEEFMETIIDSMSGSFSDGEHGKEEKQIFRANVLIPDDDEFFNTYSKDKNIRNLMNTYSVGIEDVMSKITELNIYADYLEASKKTKPKAKKVVKEEDDSFVDAMVNLSSKDAESLLDEIENLSSVMEEFNIASDIEEKPSKEVFDEPMFDIEEKEEPIPEKPAKKSTKSKEKNVDLPDGDYAEMSIDDISMAVDGFVDDYNSIQTDLDNIKTDLDKAKKELKSNKDIIDEQKEQIKVLREEAYSLKKNNLESAKSLKEARKANEALENENATLKDQVKVMEDKIRRSSALLKKIYNSIPRK